jgi:hypothetical protein
MKFDYCLACPPIAFNIEIKRSFSAGKIWEISARIFFLIAVIFSTGQKFSAMF